jgi:PAT family beta-lactamase induction signal transducer AmpG
MGLAYAPFGLMGGFTVVTLPQMLAAQGVPGGSIAEIVAVCITPTFWAFLVSPLLDVRFRRRNWALGFALLMASASAFTVLHHRNIFLVEAVMTAGYAAAALYAGAVGGWTGALIGEDQDSTLGVWFSVANAGAGSIMIFLVGRVIDRWSLPAIAALVAGLILLPLLLFLVIPAPEPDKTLASESFSRFWRDVLSLLKRREVLVALPLFLLPSASFSLTNTLAGWGLNFSANPRQVALYGALATSIGGIGGSFLIKPLAKLLPLRPMYLGIGIVGASFTLSLLLFPRTPALFGVAMIGENIFQAMAFAAAYAIVFEVIGTGNPLAATTFLLLLSAESLPVVYMGAVDGTGFNWNGVAGGFLADAGFGLAACLLLAILLRRWLWSSPRPPRNIVEHSLS